MPAVEDRAVDDALERTGELRRRRANALASRTTRAGTSRRGRCWHRATPAAGRDRRVFRTLVPRQRLAAGIILRPSDPVYLVTWDAVLAEQQTQLGGMLLDVAHVVEL